MSGQAPAMQSGALPRPGDQSGVVGRRKVDQRTGRASAPRRDGPTVATQRRAGQRGPLLVALLCVLAVLAGLYIRDEFIIDAAHGVGYGLGITGATLMLLLLLYPIQKRRPSFSFGLNLQQSFRLHMLLGLVGPLCILYHCNFSLGSMNSNVALGCMLVMVSSGLVGRYLYARIHRGLHGERLSLNGLQAERRLSRERFDNLTEDESGDHLILDSRVQDRLHRLGQYASRQVSIPAALLRALTIGVWLLWQRIVLAFLLRRDGVLMMRRQDSVSTEVRDSDRVEIRQFVADYLQTLRRVAQLSLFERLFAAWHVFHVPVFFMLVLTVLVHIYAVHSY